MNRVLSTGLRVLLLLAMAAFILAPTPGNVGGCNADKQLGSYEQFCIDSQALYCARDYRKGFIDDEVYEACLADVEPYCYTTNWNPELCSPPPSQRRIDACINALRSVERLSIPNDLVLECQIQVLCADEE